MSERVSWMDPRVIVAVVFGMFSAFAQVLTFAGFMIGVYVISQKRDAASDVSSATLVQKIDEVKGQIALLSGDVKASSNQALELKGKSEQNTRDIERETREREGTDGEHNARITVLEKNVAGLQAAK